MRVLLVEPYYSGSHRSWADGYRTFSDHDVTLVTHPAQFWKWRMHGGFLTMADQVRPLVEEGGPFATTLVSSMIDVARFRGLLGPVLGRIVVYMHENQLTYPLSDIARPDLTYAMTNWASMTAADEVWFNSEFHRSVWFENIGKFLRQFPDESHERFVTAVEQRAVVMPVGVDLRRLDGATSLGDGPPIVLWNQRWEYDKAPEVFFAALFELMNKGLEFRVVIAGENFRNEPADFEAARARLGERVIHYGFAQPDDYATLLASADVVVSTATQEFFGIAIVEAMYAGAFPVLPNRLVYPERIPLHVQDLCLYDDFEGLVTRLEWAIRHQDQVAESALGLRETVARFDWSIIARQYDRRLSSLASGPT